MFNTQSRRVYRPRFIGVGDEVTKSNCFEKYQRYPLVTVRTSGSSEECMDESLMQGEEGRGSESGGGRCRTRARMDVVFLCSTKEDKNTSLEEGQSSSSLPQAPQQCTRLLRSISNPTLSSAPIPPPPPEGPSKSRNLSHSKSTSFISPPLFNPQIIRTLTIDVTSSRLCRIHSSSSSFRKLSKPSPASPESTSFHPTVTATKGYPTNPPEEHPSPPVPSPSLPITPDTAVAPSSPSSTIDTTNPSITSTSSPPHQPVQLITRKPYEEEEPATPPVQATPPSPLAQPFPVTFNAEPNQPQPELPSTLPALIHQPSPLPLPSHSSDSPSSNSPRHLKRPLNSSKEIKLLFAEDSSIARILNKQIALRAGFQCDIAADGAECLQLVQSNPQTYDLILMDLIMPVMDGFEAAERIKKLGLNVPIVPLTGVGTDDMKQRCLTAGMLDFLEKPLTVSKLKALLMEHNIL